MKIYSQFKRSRIALIVFAALLLSAIANAVPNETPVKNIVLVHGAFTDGSGSESVYRILTKRGYNVIVVASPNTSLADDVAVTQRVLARQEGQGILVVHSYGSVISTEAGNAENVAGLVYIAAFAPDAGESIISLLPKLPPTLGNWVAELPLPPILE